MALLPEYFYDLNGRMPDGNIRWWDSLYDVEENSMLELIGKVGLKRHAKLQRNEAYKRWIASKCVRVGEALIPLLKSKQMLWQAVRVMSYKHSESESNDWWENYQDAVFRVFVQPETIYDNVTGEHKQWYLLSPEDSYMTVRYEMERDGASLPPRDYAGQEIFLSKDKRLRQSRLIPVECCRHLRHETTAGELPDGL